MTPGFAKTRAELPYLYYPKADRVIINAHNFSSGAFNPAVNGKSPLSVWCPSKDTTGNGTTTLYDLVGSNNGTLTSMDAATDWVADSDAGGVRALDFDGVNDRVALASNSAWPAATATNAISLWCKLGALTSATLYVLLRTGVGGSGGAYVAINRLTPASVRWRITYLGKFDQDFTAGTLYGADDGAWHHVLISHDATHMRLYVDGVLRDSVERSNHTANSPSGTGSIGSFSDTAFPYFGRMDDIRLFNQSLDATDASDLHAAQRGGNA